MRRMGEPAAPWNDTQSRFSKAPPTNPGKWGLKEGKPLQPFTVGNKASDNTASFYHQDDETWELKTAQQAGGEFFDKNFQRRTLPFVLSLSGTVRPWIDKPRFSSTMQGLWRLHWGRFWCRILKVLYALALHLQQAEKDLKFPQSD